ncbi:hypothetical protein HED55_27115 [Ochrobactrum haematophilum]|uniref:Uncharacterized protein n=1 Tax=Brucella haematophila TaxID=419474 RepID=A0ABX1DR85_9HYPH|nr:hypothetical protein [Brucella haematophila]
MLPVAVLADYNENTSKLEGATLIRSSTAMADLLSVDTRLLPAHGRTWAIFNTTEAAQGAIGRTILQRIRRALRARQQSERPSIFERRRCPSGLGKHAACRA